MDVGSGIQETAPLVDKIKPQSEQQQGPDSPVGAAFEEKMEVQDYQQQTGVNSGSQAVATLEEMEVQDQQQQQVDVGADRQVAARLNKIEAQDQQEQTDLQDVANGGIIDVGEVNGIIDVGSDRSVAASLRGTAAVQGHQQHV